MYIDLLPAHLLALKDTNISSVMLLFCFRSGGHASARLIACPVLRLSLDAMQGGRVCYVRSSSLLPGGN